MRELLAGQSERERVRLGRRLAAMVAAAPEWQHARTVFAFYGSHGEPATNAVIQLALRDGRTVALPRVTGNELSFHIVDALAQLRPGYRGIPEPPGDLGRVMPDALAGAFVMVPGLAFDRSGRRLGRGGGYYDRFLAGLRAGGANAVVAGICSSRQLVSSVAVEIHDQPVDLIITEIARLAAGGTRA